MQNGAADVVQPERHKQAAHPLPFKFADVQQGAVAAGQLNKGTVILQGQDGDLNNLSLLQSVHPQSSLLLLLLRSPGDVLISPSLHSSQQRSCINDQGCRCPTTGASSGRQANCAQQP